MNWMEPIEKAERLRRQQMAEALYGNHTIGQVLARNDSAFVVNGSANEHYQGVHRAGAMTARRYYAIGFNDDGREVVHVSGIPTHNNGRAIRKPTKVDYDEQPWFNIKECFRPCCFSGSDAVMDVFLPRDPKPKKYPFPHTMVVGRTTRRDRAR